MVTEEDKTTITEISKSQNIRLLDVFFKQLEVKNINFDKILFLSDHGSRNQRDNYESNHNVLFILKDKSLDNILIKEKKFSQDEFKKIFLYN